MKIKVDQEKCISCGTCIALASQSFQWNQEGTKAIAIDPSTDDIATVKDAVNACPVQAIIVEE